MKDLLAVIAKGLVDDPDSVSVEADAPNEEGTVVYHIHAALRAIVRIALAILPCLTTWAESSVSRAELPRLSAQLPAVPLSAVKKKLWLKSTD